MRVFDSSSSNLLFNVLIVLFRQKCPLVSVIVVAGLANLSCSCDHCVNIENKPDKGLLPQNQFCFWHHVTIELQPGGAIHSTKISGNFGPNFNGSVRSNRKSFEKTVPPFEVVLFSRSDRLELVLNGSRPGSLKVSPSRSEGTNRREPWERD